MASCDVTMNINKYENYSISNSNIRQQHIQLDFTNGLGIVNHNYVTKNKDKN